MKKSEALKGVKITSIEETVDRAMQFLPQTMDLTDSDNRRKVRNWMVRVAQIVTQDNAATMKRATASAIDEAAALAIDPNFYAAQTDRRRKYKTQRAVFLANNKPRSKAEMAFDRLTAAPIKM